MDALALAPRHLWLASEGFHCPQLTPIFRNSRSLCIIHSQDSSLMPPKMRKVQTRAISFGTIARASSHSNGPQPRRSSSAG